MWVVEPDLSKFISENESFLLEHEAHNNMLLQALSRSVQHPSETNAGFKDGKGTIALLFNGSLIFNETKSADPQSLASVIQDFLDGSFLRMVMGPENLAREFARQWLQKNPKLRFEHELSMVLQKIEKVNAIKRPPGQFRRAWIEEADLLATWLGKFRDETGVPGDDSLTSKELALQLIHSNQLFVWGNNRPASMVGIGGSTPKGIRVHSVYTPAEKRGQGLAKATVAALSEHQLALGKEFLVLYSDATRPANGALYNQIGYQPIANHFTYFFAEK